jgi:hypothetical protein
VRGHHAEVPLHRDRRLRRHGERGRRGSKHRRRPQRTAEPATRRAEPRRVPALDEDRGHHQEDQARRRHELLASDGGIPARRHPHPRGARRSRGGLFQPRPAPDARRGGRRVTRRLELLRGHRRTFGSLPAVLRRDPALGRAHRQPRCRPRSARGLHRTRPRDPTCREGRVDVPDGDRGDGSGHGDRARRFRAAPVQDVLRGLQRGVTAGHAHPARVHRLPDAVVARHPRRHGGRRGGEHGLLPDRVGQVHARSCRARDAGRRRRGPLRRGRAVLPGPRLDDARRRPGARGDGCGDHRDQQPRLPARARRLSRTLCEAASSGCRGFGRGRRRRTR